MAFMASAPRFRKWTLFTLFYCMAVIVWGAYVRATGSGAGCGNHWPLCNGQVLPTQPELRTLIEFTHRASSGLSLILVISVSIWARRLFLKGSFGRRAAQIAFFSILLEALIGAFLVLFELVSQDQSLKRVISITLHFANTLVLLGSLTLLTRDPKRLNQNWNWNNRSLKTQALAFAAAFFLLGMAGAITALGDTLFPAKSLTEGLKSDFYWASHFLVKLRVFHPMIALSFGALVLPWIFSKTQEHLHGSEKRLGSLLLLCLLTNIGVGILNILFLAPLAIQLLHLTIAISSWVLFVLFLDLVVISGSQISDELKYKEPPLKLLENFSSGSLNTLQ